MSNDEKKPRVRLVGQDGNAVAIIMACRRAAKRAGWSAERIDAVEKDMKSGSYDHLLGVALTHFDVE